MSRNDSDINLVFINVTIKPLTHMCAIDILQETFCEQKTRELYASALADLGKRDLPDHLATEIAGTLATLLDAHLGVLRTSKPEFDSLAAHLTGKPVLTTFITRRRNAAAHLKALLTQLEIKKYRPGGYDANALKEEAQISKDLWQKLRRAAGIKVERGNSNKKFSNREIRVLVDVARKHGTPKSIRAADAWKQLVDDNQVPR